MPPVLETQQPRRERRTVQVGGRVVGFEAATKIILGLFKVFFYFPKGKSTIWGIYSEYF
jgi:hypothetical protein